MLTEDLHICTPTLESAPLSSITGKSIYLKMECYQTTGAFKIRGIGLLCQEYVKLGKKHLVASSGGNAGYATAYTGRKLGVKTTIFVPEQTPQSVIKNLKSLGADVKVHGNSLDGAERAAKEFIKTVNGGYIHPFDHPTIWAGHSTLVDELQSQMKKPDAIVMSVGGGGLMCGILEGLYRNNWKNVHLFGVETEGTNSLAASLEAGERVTLDEIKSIATTLGAKQVAEAAFSWAKKAQVTPLTVTDQDTVEACRRFLDDHHVLVEPACGAALSVIYNNLRAFKKFNSILVIVCGGIGITLDQLIQYLEL